MFDTSRHDEAARRSYWTGQLDEAHAFMMRAMEYPVAECGERLVSLADAASEAGVEVAFSQRPHVHALPRIYVLREGQIAGFVDAARRLNRRGWIMRVEDGYRNRTMQKGIGLQPQVFDVVLHRVIWELNGRTPEPAFLFKRLLTLAAQIPSTATHMSGSAIDISVLEEKGSGSFSRNGPQVEEKGSGTFSRNGPQGASQKRYLTPFLPPFLPEVDRGGPYLEMSECAPMNSPFVTPQAQRNRQEITAILRESGFVEYPYEFWHYGSGDAADESRRGMGRPARYGAVDLDVATGRVTPIEKPQTPLNSLEQIQTEIQAAMDRYRRENTPA